MHVFEVGLVVCERREEVRTHRELARVKKSLVDVGTDGVGARDEREGHIADGGDAHRVEAADVVAVDGEQRIVGQHADQARDVGHRRGLVQDAREVAVGVAVEAAARGGLGRLVDAELGEAARVEPERVGVAGVQRDRAVGKGGIEFGVGRGSRVVPERRAPAVCEHPAGVARTARTARLGQRPRELHQVRDFVFLARADVLRRERRGEESRVEHVLVRVVQAVGDEGVAVVAHISRGSDEGVSLVGGHDGRDQAAVDADGQRAGPVTHPREDTRRHNDTFARHTISHRRERLFFFARILLSGQGNGSARRAGLPMSETSPRADECGHRSSLMARNADGRVPSPQTRSSAFDERLPSAWTPVSAVGRSLSQSRSRTNASLPY